MAESNEHEQCDLNTFKEGMGAKSIEKEAMNLEGNENDIKEIDSSAASIAYDIDEDIASIQAEAIRAASKTMNAKNSTGEEKQNNLEIEAALNNTFVTDVEEDSSSDIGDRASRTECQLAAYFAEKTSEEARRVLSMGQDLMETLTTTIQVLQSHVQAFSEKAVDAGEQETERGYQTSDFYTTMASKYEASVTALKKRAKNVEVALSRCEQAAKECLKYAELAKEVSDETLDASKRAKFSACWWTNKGRAAIIVTLKKERAALLMMKRMWLSVSEDMEYEERQSTEEDSDEETQQCENRDRKTMIAHIVASLLGIALLSVTSLFPVGSDSFNAILALGLLTVGWCAVYWSHKFYKCLREHDKEQQTVVETPDDDIKDGFLENCERRLEIVLAELRQYNVAMDSETESDTGSWETVRVEDASE